MEYMKAHNIVLTQDKNNNRIWTVEDCNGKKLRITLCKKMVSDCKEGKC